MMGSSNPSLSSPYQSSPHNGRLKTRNTFMENTSLSSSSMLLDIHQLASEPDLGLTVLVFKQGDDPIDAINHMMSFLSAVVTSRYPTTKNQLRNSSNPRQQTIINDGRVTLQPVQGRQISFVTDKVLLVQAQENGQILHEEELAFLADLGIAKDVLTEVYNPDNIDNNMINQSVQAISSSEQSSVVIHLETDITSDSNIILYSQYVHETQQRVIQMMLKEQDPMVLEKKVNTTLVDYVALNQLSQDFEKQFVLQTELSAKQAFWSQKSMNSSNPIPSCTPTRVEVPKELPKEQVAILREAVETGKSQSPLNNSLDSTCNYTKRIQELLIIIRQTCPSINNSSDKLVVVTPKNKGKRVRFTKPITSSGNTNTQTDSLSNLVSNKPALSSTRVKPSTSTSESQPLGTALVQHYKLNANSKLICVKCNGCMLSDNYDLCVLNVINDVNDRPKSKFVKKTSKRKVWKPIGKVFTKTGYTWRPTSPTFIIVGNAFPLTRITITTKVLTRKPTILETNTPKPIVKLVYSRKPRKSKTNFSFSKPKIIKALSANNKEPSKS
nr:hypothetical protein [Tanacetum cinerariifolium]